MKAYKATNNMRCNNLKYEIGKTYSIDKMKMCKYGFHYCKEQKDTLDYYPYTDDFTLLEVEILGKNVIQITT